jgi:ribonuclease E
LSPELPEVAEMPPAVHVAHEHAVDTATDNVTSTMPTADQQLLSQPVALAASRTDDATNDAANEAAVAADVAADIATVTATIAASVAAIETTAMTENHASSHDSGDTPIPTPANNMPIEAPATTPMPAEITAETAVTSSAIVVQEPSAPLTQVLPDSASAAVHHAAQPAIEEVLQEAGLVMVQTTAAPVVTLEAAPPMLGRKPKPAPVLVEEPLQLVETGAGHANHNTQASSSNG